MAPATTLAAPPGRLLLVLAASPLQTQAADFLEGDPGSGSLDGGEDGRQLDPEGQLVEEDQAHWPRDHVGCKKKMACWDCAVLPNTAIRGRGTFTPRRVAHGSAADGQATSQVHRGGGRALLAFKMRL